MKVAVDERDRALTQRVLTIFTDEPGKDRDINDLATLLKEDPKRVRTAINNLRSANPRVAAKLKVLVPGTLYRYVNGEEKQELKPPPPPAAVKDFRPRRAVEERPLPETKLEETTVIMGPPEKKQEEDSDLMVLRKVGTTRKGTIIAEGEDDQFYAIRVVDL